MLEDGLDLRLMTQADVQTALEIIRANDEDDAEEAHESYSELGLENQFVLTKNETILGVTGCREASGSFKTYWISWTYLHPDHHGKGLGSQMLNELLERMRAGDIRKVFVSTSDYEDEKNGKVYAAAQRMYENAGFDKEIEHPNYYSPGETQLIYGLPLIEIQSDITISPDDTCVYFNGLKEIEETDDVYVINWEAQKKKLFGKNTQFTSGDLEIGIKQAAEWNARSVFISFPSNMPSVIGPLEAAGFFAEGRLKDYYEDGLDEIHFRYNLSQ